jgi:hypothetical protein
MAVETVEVYDLVLVTETAKAYLVQDHEGIDHWIPISQVEYIEYGAQTFLGNDGRSCKTITRMVIPEWIAKKHNMV